MDELLVQTLSDRNTPTRNCQVYIMSLIDIFPPHFTKSYGALVDKALERDTNNHATSSISSRIFKNSENFQNS